MAMPSHPSRFPDDTGADSFVSAFPTIVAPQDPARLSTKPPLVILRIPEISTPADATGPVYRGRVRRVLNALESSLQEPAGDKRVPYALLRAEEHSDSGAR
jgi:hypothetical protein